MTSLNSEDEDGKAFWNGGILPHYYTVS